MNRADSLLTPFIKELGIEDGVRLAKIKMNWHNLFNKPLSDHMSPSMLSGDEIVLNVDSPVWLQELNFYKEDIIKKMSAYGVKAVRLRLGRLSTGVKSGVSGSSRTDKGRESRVKKLTTEELSYIEKVVSSISDEVLKETIRKAIEKALTSGQTRQ